MHQILERNFSLREQMAVTYYAVPAAGTPFERIMQPDYWAHIARRVKVGSEIVVQPEDGAYYARLLIVYVATGTVQVKELMYVELIAPVGDTVAEEDITIRYSGPIAKWRVTRNSDGCVLAEGAVVATKALAQQFVLNYRQSMAA